jgi:uncharacterized protein YjbJ (UPF0337 family)
MKLSTRYQAKGMFRVARGTVKGIVAKLSANRAMGARGRLERIAGRMQCRIGRVQGVFGL